VPHDILFRHVPQAYAAKRASFSDGPAANSPTPRAFRIGSSQRSKTAVRFGRTMRSKFAPR
jgi:hypothetical protein